MAHRLALVCVDTVKDSEVFATLSINTICNLMQLFLESVIQSINVWLCNSSTEVLHADSLRELYQLMPPSPRKSHCAIV